MRLNLSITPIDNTIYTVQRERVRVKLYLQW
jgi:hypothetical protein